METYVLLSSAHVQTLLGQNIHDQGVVIVPVVVAAVVDWHFCWSIGAEIKMVLVITFIIFCCFLFTRLTFCLLLFLPSELCLFYNH